MLWDEEPELLPEDPDEEEEPELLPEEDAPVLPPCVLCGFVPES